MQIKSSCSLSVYWCIWMFESICLVAFDFDFAMRKRLYIAVCCNDQIEKINQFEPNTHTHAPNTNWHLTPVFFRSLKRYTAFPTTLFDYGNECYLFYLLHRHESKKKFQAQKNITPHKKNSYKWPEIRIKSRSTNRITIFCIIFKCYQHRNKKNNYFVLVDYKYLYEG